MQPSHKKKKHTMVNSIGAIFLALSIFVVMYNFAIFCYGVTGLDILFLPQEPEVRDLIRLDSTPSDEDFDPLLCKGSAFDQSSSSTSRVNPFEQYEPVSSFFARQQTSQQKNSHGLSNPLYSCHVPLKLNEREVGPEPCHHSDLSLNLSSNAASASFPSFGTNQPTSSSSEASLFGSCSMPTTSVTKHTESDSQDLDLLKEYGIDFRNISLQNGASSLDNVSSPSEASPCASSLSMGQVGIAQSQSSAPLDPFEDLVKLSKLTVPPPPPARQKPQSRWTKFE